MMCKATSGNFVKHESSENQGRCPTTMSRVDRDARGETVSSCYKGAIILLQDGKKNAVDIEALIGNKSGIFGSTYF
jgi:hypothetical protein